MSNAKPKPKSRRVVGYGEEPMRRYSVRLSKAEYEKVLEIGDGNFSLGVRRLIEKIDNLSSAEKLQLSERHQQQRRKVRSNSARSRGRPSLTAETIKAAQDMYGLQGLTIKEITASLNIHISTVYKYVDVRKKKPCSLSRSSASESDDHNQ